MTASTIELAPGNDGFSLISNRKLLTLYSAMLACRSFAENSGRSKKKTGGAESIAGHEAAAVGAAIDLASHDTVAPALWPDAAMQTINPSVTVAASISHAAGSALADRNGGKITLLFANGRRSSQSAWLKALTRAAEDNLPMMFVSLSEPGAIPAEDRTIPLKRRGYSLPMINVDGDDVVAVYRVASEAIAHARKGHGPTLIDCRLSGSGDPILNMREYLASRGLNPE